MGCRISCLDIFGNNNKNEKLNLKEKLDYVTFFTTKLVGKFYFLDNFEYFIVLIRFQVYGC